MYANNRDTACDGNRAGVPAEATNPNAKELNRGALDELADATGADLLLTTQMTPTHRETPTQVPSRIHPEAQIIVTTTTVTTFLCTLVYLFPNDTNGNAINTYNKIGARLKCPHT